MKLKQVKPGFINYQPQPKYSWALSNIKGKGKRIIETIKEFEKSENFGKVIFF